MMPFYSAGKNPAYSVTDGSWLNGFMTIYISKLASYETENGDSK
jgi:hypothetical protein